MLFAHFSLAATSAFCTFGLIKGIWEYMQATWFVKMRYPVTVLWAGTFLFSLLWCCKVVPFEQLHTKVYDRPTKIAEFTSTVRRGSKIDFLAVLTILCSIEWARILGYAYSKSTILEVFRESVFEYRFYLALINVTTFFLLHWKVTVYLTITSAALIKIVQEQQRGWIAV